MARKKRVAIVGKGPGRGLAPLTGEVWCINNSYIGQYATMIFDIHNLDWSLEECFDYYDHLADILTDEERWERARLRQRAFKLSKDYANEHNIPIMSQKVYDDCPSLEYPLDAIIKKFDCDMLTSATPYAVAYACYRKYTHIDLYGINCLYNEEWQYQRDAVVGWIMFAKGMGIKVTVTGQPGRPLRCWDGKLYGYNIPQPERGVPQRDGIIDLESGQRMEFDVWMEYN